MVSYVDSARGRTEKLKKIQDKTAMELVRLEHGVVTMALSGQI
jgi:hypothetical protein